MFSTRQSCTLLSLTRVCIRIINVYFFFLDMSGYVVKTSASGEHLNDPGHPIHFCRKYFPAPAHVSDTVSRLAWCLFPPRRPHLHTFWSRARTVSRATQMGLPNLLCSSGRKGCDALRHLSLPVGSTSALRSVLFSLLELVFWTTL